MKSWLKRISERRRFLPFNFLSSSLWSRQCAQLISCSPSLSSDGFTVSEVLQSLKVVKPYQYPHPDSEHPMVLEKLAPVIAPTLTELFTQPPSFSGSLLNEELRPSVPFSRAVLEVILSPIIRSAGRAMKQVVSNRLRYHLLTNELLCTGQNVFRPQRSFISNVERTQEHWAFAKALCLPTYVMFVDFSKGSAWSPVGGTQGARCWGPFLRWIGDFLTGGPFSV